MNTRTEFQVIVGQDGKPAFVVVPYEQFRRMKGGFTYGTVPNEVVNLSFERGVSAMAAWREHFGHTQVEVAARIGITQAAYAQMERVKQPRRATLEKRAPSKGPRPTHARANKVIRWQFDVGFHVQYLNAKTRLYFRIAAIWTRKEPVGTVPSSATKIPFVFCGKMESS